MPVRFSIRIFVVAALAVATVAAAQAPNALADESSLPCLHVNNGGCRMAIPQLRVVPADHKIDWGASDYTDADRNVPNNVTAPYTATTADDYPPATTPGPHAQDVTGAGAHPDLNIFVRYCGEQLFEHALSSNTCKNPEAYNFGRLRNLTVKLPPGMIGNPQAVAPCPWAILMLGVAESVCANSIVGVARNWTLTYPGESGIGQDQAPRDVPIYNTETIGGEPARLATDWRVDGSIPPLPIVFAARQRKQPDGHVDVGIDSFTNNIPAYWSPQRKFLKIYEQNITLFSRAPVTHTQPDYTDTYPEAPGAKPFFSNPTSCGEKTVTLVANSWEEGSADQVTSHAEASDSFNITGCDNSATQPKLDRPASDPGGADAAAVTAGPDFSRGGTDQAGAPTAYTVKVHMPDTEQSAVHGSHLKEATVTLPKGVTLAPGAGNGLEGCDASQFNLDDPDGAMSCPAGSKIADVSVTTPILANPLSGGAFFATPDQPGPPTDAHPWKLYLLIEGFGNRIKLAGDVTSDPDSGQITTKFTNNPQVPFTDLELRLNGGDHSILQNPTDCSPHEGSAELVGWSGDTKTLTPSVTVSNCSDDPPFQPTVSANADDMSAGASSPSHLGVDRPDGDARMSKLQLALPNGLVGSLTTVPLCPASDVVAGTCGDASKIGTLTTTIGYGSATLNVPGSLYLGKGTEPGDAAALSAVIPSKIGPIDLGNVVIVNHIKLRQSDGGLTAVTEEIPKIVGGIPIYVKKIKIDVNRPGFLTNPTGCDPRTLTGDFTSENSKTATASVELTATNCDKLPFGPKLSMTAIGEHGRFQHPGLKAVVTQTPGEAAIKRAVVILPETLRPELPTITKSLCTTPQLNANACPAASIVGNAIAYTPLLPEPLTGPVYLVQDPNINDPLPKIVVRLAGIASIDLTARNTIQGVRTVNTFASIPDVPVTSFELNIKGGKPGILKNFYELCDQPSRADATFTGQNGKVHVTKPLLQLPNCATSATGGPSIKSSTVTMSQDGYVSLKVRCGSAGCATGKASIQTGGRASAAKSLGSKSFSVGANKTKTVKIKLSKSARRVVLRRKKISAKAVVTVGATKVNKNIKIKAPKKKKR
jgi:hypothetical protein